MHAQLTTRWAVGPRGPRPEPPVTPDRQPTRLDGGSARAVERYTRCTRLVRSDAELDCLRRDPTATREEGAVSAVRLLGQAQGGGGITVVVESSGRRSSIRGETGAHHQRHLPLITPERARDGSDGVIGPALANPERDSCPTLAPPPAAASLHPRSSDGCGAVRSQQSCFAPVCI